MATSKIFGTLYIDFETDKKISTEQFKEFKKQLNHLVDNWEIMIYDIAEQCGFEADSVHPIVLDDLDLDLEYED